MIIMKYNHQALCYKCKGRGTPQISDPPAAMPTAADPASRASPHPRRGAAPPPKNVAAAGRLGKEP